MANPKPDPLDPIKDVGSAIGQSLAGAALGFASGFTGHDVLSPFLNNLAVQDAKNQKELKDRIKVLSQARTLVNSDPEALGQIRQALGVKEEATPDDIVQGLADLGQEGFNIVRENVRTERLRRAEKSDNAEQRAKVAQAEFQELAPQAQVLGIPVAEIDPTSPEQVSALSGQIKAHKESQQQSDKELLQIQTDFQRMSSALLEDPNLSLDNFDAATSVFLARLAGGNFTDAQKASFASQFEAARKLATVVSKTNKMNLVRQQARAGDFSARADLENGTPAEKQIAFELNQEDLDPNSEISRKYTQLQRLLGTGAEIPEDSSLKQALRFVSEDGSLEEAMNAYGGAAIAHTFSKVSLDTVGKAISKQAATEKVGRDLTALKAPYETLAAASPLAESLPPLEELRQIVDDGSGNFTVEVNPTAQQKVVEAIDKLFGTPAPADLPTVESELKAYAPLIGQQNMAALFAKFKRASFDAAQEAIDLGDIDKIRQQARGVSPESISDPTWNRLGLVISKAYAGVPVDPVDIVPGIRASIYGHDSGFNIQDTIRRLQNDLSRLEGVETEEARQARVDIQQTADMLLSVQAEQKARQFLRPNFSGAAQLILNGVNSEGSLEDMVAGALGRSAENTTGESKIPGLPAFRQALQSAKESDTPLADSVDALFTLLESNAPEIANRLLGADEARGGPSRADLIREIGQLRVRFEEARAELLPGVSLARQKRPTKQEVIRDPTSTSLSGLTVNIPDPSDQEKLEQVFGVKFGDSFRISESNRVGDNIKADENLTDLDWATALVLNALQ